MSSWSSGRNDDGWIPSLRNDDRWTQGGAEASSKGRASRQAEASWGWAPWSSDDKWTRSTSETTSKGYSAQGHGNWQGHGKKWSAKRSSSLPNANASGGQSNAKGQAESRRSQTAKRDNGSATRHSSEPRGNHKSTKEGKIDLADASAFPDLLSAKNLPAPQKKQGLCLKRLATPTRREHKQTDIAEPVRSNVICPMTGIRRDDRLTEHMRERKLASDQKLVEAAKVDVAKPVEVAEATTADVGMSCSSSQHAADEANAVPHSHSAASSEGETCNDAIPNDLPEAPLEDLGENETCDGAVLEESPNADVEDLDAEAAPVGLGESDVGDAAVLDAPEPEAPVKDSSAEGESDVGDAAVLDAPEPEAPVKDSSAEGVEASPHPVSEASSPSQVDCIPHEPADDHCANEQLETFEVSAGHNENSCAVGDEISSPVPVEKDDVKSATGSSVKAKVAALQGSSIGGAGCETLRRVQKNHSRADGYIERVKSSHEVRRVNNCQTAAAVLHQDSHSVDPETLALNYLSIACLVHPLLWEHDADDTNAESAFARLTAAYRYHVEGTAWPYGAGSVPDWSPLSSMAFSLFESVAQSAMETSGLDSNLRDSCQNLLERQQAFQNKGVGDAEALK